MKKKRSSVGGMTRKGTTCRGVGARHRASRQGAGGLGYLDIYTKTESPIQKNRGRDPRILQLKKMGLDWRWIRIAERVGFDTFLQTWVLISDMFEDDRAYVRASIPHVKKLLRFQRNILIRRMHANGSDIRTIQAAIQKTYSTSMSLRAIRDVLHAE